MVIFILETTTFLSSSFYFRLCRHHHFLFRQLVPLYLVVFEEDVVEGVFERLQRLFSYFGLQLTFPNCDAVPAHACQFVLFFLVAGLVAFYLRLPEVCPTLRHHEILATLVAMPKATVDKDDSSILSHHDIRMPRQAWMVQPVSEPMGKQIAPHQDFRLGVLAANGGHAVAALFFCQFVHVLILVLVRYSKRYMNRWYCWRMV